jgi:glutaredoxin
MCTKQIIREDFEIHLRNSCEDIKLICPHCKHSSKTLEDSKHDCVEILKAKIEEKEKREKFITEHYLKLL